MLKIAVIGLAALSSLATFPALAAPHGVQYFSAPGAVGPFSGAVRIGNEVHVAGAIGIGPDGTLPSDFKAQATNAMNAVAAELKLAGATFNDAYKCNVALADMKNWPDFNTVYVKYFDPARLPVRMAMGVTALAKGAAVEVECEAYLSK